MSQPTYQVRRAVVDDLEGLKPLWTGMRFSVAELERRLTDFQVAVAEDGTLLGALAMEINGRQGRVHSEAFVDFGLAECLRDLLWERLQKVITNHGLTRLWTMETAPFWSRNGFQAADAAVLEKLPLAWAPLAPAWLTLQLRGEEAFQPNLEKEFQMALVAEREAVLRRAKMLRNLASILAILLAIFVIAISIAMLRGRMRFPGH